MLVRIIKASDKRMWYTGCIGEVFPVFTMSTNAMYWLSDFLYVDPADIEIVHDKSRITAIVGFYVHN